MLEEHVKVDKKIIAEQLPGLKIPTSRKTFSGIDSLGENVDDFPGIKIKDCGGKYSDRQGYGETGQSKQAGVAKCKL